MITTSGAAAAKSSASRSSAPLRGGGLALINRELGFIAVDLADFAFELAISEGAAIGEVERGIGDIGF